MLCLFAMICERKKVEQLILGGKLHYVIWMKREK